MFGDIGHGLIILFAALYMIMNEKKWAKEALDEVSNSFRKLLLTHVLASDGRTILLVGHHGAFQKVLDVLTCMQRAIHHSSDGVVLRLHRPHVQ